MRPTRRLVVGLLQPGGIDDRKPQVGDSRPSPSRQVAGYAGRIIDEREALARPAG